MPWECMNRNTIFYIDTGLYLYVTVCKSHMPFAKWAPCHRQVAFSSLSPGTIPSSLIMRSSLRHLQRFAIPRTQRKPNVTTTCAAKCAQQRALVTQADQQKDDPTVVPHKTFVPPSKVPTKDEILRLEEFVNTSDRLLVITGAGKYWCLCYLFTSTYFLRQKMKRPEIIRVDF